MFTLLTNKDLVTLGQQTRDFLTLNPTYLPYGGPTWGGVLYTQALYDSSIIITPADITALGAVIVAAIEAQTVALSADLGAIETAVDNNTSNLTTQITTQTAALSADLGAIETAVDNNTSNLTTQITTQTAALSADLGSIETATTTNNPIGANASITTVAASLVSATIVATNASRKEVIIVNRSNRILWLSYATTPAVDTVGVPLAPGGVLNENHFSGAIYGIWSGAAPTNNAVITEITT